MDRPGMDRLLASDGVFMSALAILPISSVTSSVDFAATSSLGGQQMAFNNLLSRLQQAISAGNLTSSKSLLNALDALPPTGVSETAALSKFLAGVGSALAGGNLEQAQNALSSYQAETRTTAISSSPEFGKSAAVIANDLVQSQLQMNLVSALMTPPGSLASTSSFTADSVSSLVSLLNNAYGTTDSSSAAATGQSPYDTLVSALKANLAAGISTAGPALAYLQSKGCLVSVDA